MLHVVLTWQWQRRQSKLVAHDRDINSIVTVSSSSDILHLSQSQEMGECGILSIGGAGLFGCVLPDLFLDHFGSFLFAGRSAFEDLERFN